jgi:very-short-patch-repair endonuclease
LLLPEEMAMTRGLSVTTPERTLTDRLRDTSVADITRMLEQLVTHLNRSPDDLHTWGHGLVGVAGKAKLIRALDEVVGPVVVRSQFEALFRSVCQDGGLPQAQTNYPIGRWEVDAVFPEFGLAVELDSYRYHGGRWSFDRDRRKGTAINRAGFELVRISWPQLKYNPSEIIETLQITLTRCAGRRWRNAVA